MAVEKKIKLEKTDLQVQSRFIARLKELLPVGFGLAEEIADVLGVSIDSAYRRIRGETELTIGEIFRLNQKYPISLDSIFGNENQTVTFSYTKLTNSVVNFEQYLNRLHGHLSTINQFEHRKIYYVAEEIPMFYSFFSKKLSEFKLFYWQRSVLNIEEYQKTKFEWGIVPQHLIDIAHGSYLEYMNIPSVEIWTDETVLTLIKQISFYFDSGIISQTQAGELLQEYRKMIDMVYKNAEEGRKNSSDKNETFFLYNSNVVLGTNCIYAIMGESTFSYISFNSINSLTTNNKTFCEETEHWLRNLERKSTLISKEGEKHRYQFFSQMFKNIDLLIEKIAQN
jgi:hypothetical protein